MFPNRLTVSMLFIASVLSPLSVYAQSPVKHSDRIIVGDNNQVGGKKPSDAMFLHKASEGGYAEVEFGKLAVQKGGSDEVKQFGQKMIDDHTALNTQLKPFADAKNITAPTELGKKEQPEYDKLSGLSGDAFDKEYLAYMVKDHHADMKEFHKEAMFTKDESLKDAVQKGEKVIRDHTEMVEKLAKDKGVMTPMHKAAATSGAE